jgi:biopolymer transport protein ExbD
MKFPRQARIFRGQLDAAPFVGVLFLVAIFLLLNSSLVSMPGVAIQLPEAADWPGVNSPTVVVAVDGKGRLYFKSQVIKQDALKQELRRAVRRSPGPLTLVLVADKSVPHETTVRLCELAREAGLKQVLLTTRPTPASSPAKANQ